jgi:hypothetical protein
VVARGGGVGAGVREQDDVAGDRCGGGAVSGADAERDLRGEASVTAQQLCGSPSRPMRIRSLYRYVPSLAPCLAAGSPNYLSIYRICKGKTKATKSVR